MLRLKKVAVTGGLASGKSSVCRIFKTLGAYVVSSDAIVHELLSSSEPIISEVQALLGLKEKKKGLGLDRGEIAEIVFKDEAKLKLLEAILHPAVRDEIERRYKAACLEGKWPLFVAEIPLLFEANSGVYPYDATVAVVTDPKIAAQRYVSQKGKTLEDYIDRSSKQLSQEQKAFMATYTLTNNGTAEALQSGVEKLFHTLTSNP